MIGSLAQRATVTAVQAFGSFADHHEIDLTRILQRAGRARVQRGGAQVDRVIQLETQWQEQSALQHSGGNRARVADGAQQDGIVFPQRSNVLSGESFPVAQVTTRTEVVFGDLNVIPHCLQHLERFWDYFGADSISGNHREFHCVDSLVSLVGFRCSLTPPIV